MKQYLAYIDETGDPNFNPEASRYFFMGAVVFEKELLDTLDGKLSEIKRQYGIGRLKSAHISDFRRRYAICKELASLEIKVVTVFVEKEKLVGDWFRYKKGFYKFIQRKLNHEIYRLFSSVEVTLDQYGSEEYQASLQSYLINRLQRELFDPEVRIGTAKTDSFIQVADFIIGSLRKAIQKDFDDNFTIINLFSSIWITRITIPDVGRNINYVAGDNPDIEIDFCIGEAYRYLNRDDTNLNDVRIKTLEYLYYSALDNPNEYIFTQELIDWLSTLDIKISEENFRTEVTASLRDEGLIIVGTRKGIKIPTKVGDLYKYIDFSTRLALPVLRRLKKAITFVETRDTKIKLRESLSEEMNNILNQVNA